MTAPGNGNVAEIRHRTSLHFHYLTSAFHDGGRNGTFEDHTAAVFVRPGDLAEKLVIAPFQQTRYAFLRWVLRIEARTGFRKIRQTAFTIAPGHFELRGAIDRVSLHGTTLDQLQCG